MRRSISSRTRGVAVDGYQAARSRQVELINDLEALDMTLWKLRNPTTASFHYPKILPIEDRGQLEHDILATQREIDNLQGIINLYEQVEEVSKDEWVVECSRPDRYRSYE